MTPIVRYRLMTMGIPRFTPSKLDSGMRNQEVASKRRQLTPRFPAKVIQKGSARRSYNGSIGKVPDGGTPKNHEWHFRGHLGVFWGGGPLNPRVC